MFCHARMISDRFWSFFSLPVKTTQKYKSGYIKWSFSIGYFERYVNSKSDYLELLLNVYCERVISSLGLLKCWQDISRGISENGR